MKYAILFLAMPGSFVAVAACGVVAVKGAKRLGTWCILASTWTLAHDAGLATETEIEQGVEVVTETI